MTTYKHFNKLGYSELDRCESILMLPRINWQRLNVKYFWCESLSHQKKQKDRISQQRCSIKKLLLKIS